MRATRMLLWLFYIHVPSLSPSFDMQTKEAPLRARSTDLFIHNYANAIYVGQIRLLDIATATGGFVSAGVGGVREEFYCFAIEVN